MKRGFTKAWRKELESEIWIMPPVYHRVWYWLRLKSQHELYLFPTRKLYGIWVLPGQRLTSIQEIANGVKWTDNHREVVPDKRVIVRVLDWLEFNKNIEVTSNPFGTMINVINWDIYNNSTQQPVTDDVLGYVQGYDHKKRMNKNEKKEPLKRFVPPTVLEVEIYMKEIGYDGNAQNFVDSNTAKGWVIGKLKTPAKDWKAMVRTWKGNGYSNSPQLTLVSSTPSVSPEQQARIKAAREKMNAKS